MDDCWGSKWLRVGLLTAQDLPLHNGKTDLTAITAKLRHLPDTYVIACQIQTQLGKFLPSGELEVPSSQVNPLLLQQSKALLRADVSQLMSLDKWCKALNLLPLSQDEMKCVFKDVLGCCKISKFWEINYKILS